MKATLQFRITQGLKMTPQLQQAIYLLQLSNIELNAMIQEQLDSNLMLETEDDKDDLLFFQKAEAELTCSTLFSTFLSFSSI